MNHELKLQAIQLLNCVPLWAEILSLWGSCFLKVGSFTQVTLNALKSADSKKLLQEDVYNI